MWNSQVSENFPVTSILFWCGFSGMKVIDIFTGRPAYSVQNFSPTPSSPPKWFLFTSLMPREFKLFGLSSRCLYVHFRLHVCDVLLKEISFLHLQNVHLNTHE